MPTSAPSGARPRPWNVRLADSDSTACAIVGSPNNSENFECLGLDSGRLPEGDAGKRGLSPDSTPSARQCTEVGPRRQLAENRQVPVPKTERVLRPYRYLTVAAEDRWDPRLVRERVKCWKPSCRCTQDVKYRHGPYMYLRYEQYDRRTGETRYRYRREYVPAVELARVRRWIRRARAAGACGRAVMGLLRRYAQGVLYRKRRRTRMRAPRRSSGSTDRVNRPESLRGE
jgi:hypothetical protein